MEIDDRENEADLRDLVAAGVTIDPVSTPFFARGGDRPSGVRERGLFVAIHGGGYVANSCATHRRRFARIGAAAGLRVLNVGYRLAPEYPFPAAVDDCAAALRWALESGPCVIGGDSAGGALAIAATMVLRSAGETLPAAIVAISPWADLTCSLPSHTARRRRDPFADAVDPGEQAEIYLAGTPPTDPLASPLYADYTGMPPMLIQIGSEDMLFDDAVAIAERATAAGVSVHLEEWVGMFHTWHRYTGVLKGADEAIAAIGEFVRSVWAKHL